MNLSPDEPDAPPEEFALFHALGNAESVLGPYCWRVQAGHRATGSASRATI